MVSNFDGNIQALMLVLVTCAVSLELDLDLRERKVLPYHLHGNIKYCLCSSKTYFRATSNIYDNAFIQNLLRGKKPLSIFAKKAASHTFQGFPNIPPQFYLFQAL